MVDEKKVISDFFDSMANKYNITPLRAAFEFDTAYCLLLDTSKAMKFAEEKIRSEHGEKSKEAKKG